MRSYLPGVGGVWGQQAETVMRPRPGGQGDRARGTQRKQCGWRRGPPPDAVASRSATETTISPRAQRDLGE